MMVRYVQHIASTYAQILTCWVVWDRSEAVTVSEGPKSEQISMHMQLVILLSGS